KRGQGFDIDAVQLVHHFTRHGRVLVGFDRLEIQLHRPVFARGLRFELAQHGVGPLDDGVGQAGKLGDLNAVAVVGRAGNDAAQERDVVAPLFDRNVVVFDPFDVLLHAGQLMVVGGKEGFAADLVADIFYHGTGDAHAVKGRCAAADLVKDDKAPLGRVLQNLGHFGHLDHKGG